MPVFQPLRAKMLDFVVEPAFWASLILLTCIEVVLGAENANQSLSRAAGLPDEQRRRAKVLTAVLGTLFRLALLAILLWLLGLQRTAFSIAGWSPTWGGVVLLAGGLFLIYRAVTELHLMVEPHLVPHDGPDPAFSESPTLAIAQLVALSVIFSVDSIILAIGMTAYVPAMVIAIIAAIVILFFASGPIASFIARHAAIQAVALGILFVVGTVLMAEGLGMSVLRDYLYIAIGAGLLVLALSKLIHRTPASQPSISMPAAMPVQDRAEPSLEPSIPVPDDGSASAPRSVDPIFEDVPDTVLETEDFSDPAPDEINEPAPADGPLPDEIPDSDEPPLGERDTAVQRSRRKKPVLRRRPPRLRTARRRE
jgi:predicted tellurium resistance membrane protein TerC